MDWDSAIDFQRKLLLREIALLFSWLKIEPGGSVAEMSRFVANSILFVLRPAESGLRRLLVIEARRLGDRAVRRVRRSDDATATAQRKQRRRKAAGPRAARVPQFPLFDKSVKSRTNPMPVRTPKPAPRITVLNLGMSEMEFHIWQQQQRLNPKPKPKRKPLPPRNAPPNAARLCRRLHALSHALHTLPEQAERMARALARREALPSHERGDGPLRHGHPPGHRQRKKHAIDSILRECVALERNWATDGLYRPPDF